MSTKHCIMVIFKKRKDTPVFNVCVADVHVGNLKFTKFTNYGNINLPIMGTNTDLFVK